MAKKYKTQKEKDAENKQREDILNERIPQLEAERLAAKKAQLEAEEKVQTFLAKYKIGEIILSSIQKAGGDLKKDSRNTATPIPLNGQPYPGHTPAVTLNSRFKVGEFWYPGYKYESVLGGILPTVILSATVCQGTDGKLYWFVLLTIEDGLSHNQKNHTFVYPGVELAEKLAELIPVKSRHEESSQSTASNTAKTPSKAFELDFSSIEEELERNRKK